MSTNGYRLLGYTIWKGGRWYLRRRMPPVRSLALKGLAVGAVLAAAALIVRRAAG
jgi:hypothetical protein